MKKNEGIQTIRGIACIMVFLSHYIGSLANGFWLGSIDLQNSPFRLIWGGHVAVIIFFVLSGFFYKNIELNVKSYISSIIHRHVRVYPCFIIAMVVGFIARFTCPIFEPETVSIWLGSFWSGEITWKNIVASFVLLIKSNTDLINPPIWTLHTEMVMCVVLPFICIIGEKRSKYVCYFLSVICSMLHNELTFLSVFVMGICAKEMWVKREKSHCDYKAFHNILYLIGGIVLLDSRYILMTLGINVSGLLELIIHNLTGWGVVLILLFVSGVHVKRNIFSMLGDYSYEFYLMHFTLLLWFRFLIGKCGYITYGTVCFVLSCLFAFSLQKVCDKIVVWIQRKTEMLRISGNMIG